MKESDIISFLQIRKKKCYRRISFHSS